MPAALDRGFSLSMPIYLAEVLRSGAFGIHSTILGTCFSIGGSHMMSAGHVVRGLEQADGLVPIVGIQDPDNHSFKAARVMDSEILAHDIGLLTVEFMHPESTGWFHHLKWNAQPLTGFDPVRCCGYPYGQHVAGVRQSVVQRCFQGHVVADLYEFELPGSDADIFPAYELSFSAPRGLSGSPLLSNAGRVLINGVVIGNSDSQMLVYRSKEVDKDVQATTIVERYESLTLGIAVPTHAIFPMKSRILDSTIEAHLVAKGLLSR